ncbi:MAG: Cys-tRNA(Pro) deacylase [Lactobacillus sp.]|jgi:Cys-tRNA(Pro)/Cys-tRNA(Cys) deacylase|uniref:Cys-tRNA(Pro)/Cys-tRNA(Cys) deacylase n=1 Tax=Lacticaseibacillus suilingensis TaxID=2799577 RepID=A0ABW4BFY2_9LACO|nr:Cys-tRNA(Pro) deacylase [Lacticaseibacillus suilingensis]MCI1894964.1 Cys-tRNA(Pro) deacylase [Lactobacillus sp.]MCI1940775.1 Cys-tRNA(Pro) deacylase [Lactobacillus sp.]MCI1971461.1 Cys-tRNA(Pro) deacylase [Lactobacillus sp.]MCI2038408.1 Cys-tRNA(Pro) deacylase [Lactobacillus sp.]
MSKKKKEDKTLVEKMLDKQNIAYTPYEFPTHEAGDVAQLTVDHLAVPEHRIYKTLALTGNKTGPLIGVVPLDRHIDYKKLSAVSGNKKVGMIPLKDLEQTTGYEHGANTPIGIHARHKYPIFIGEEALKEPEIIVSAGKIGRSVGLAPKALAKAVNAKFAAITSLAEQEG